MEVIIYTKKINVLPERVLSRDSEESISQLDNFWKANFVLPLDKRGMEYVKSNLEYLVEIGSIPKGLGSAASRLLRRMEYLWSYLEGRYPVMSIKELSSLISLLEAGVFMQERKGSYYIPRICDDGRIIFVILDVSRGPVQEIILDGIVQYYIRGHLRGIRNRLKGGTAIKWNYEEVERIIKVLVWEYPRY